MRFEPQMLIERHEKHTHITSTVAIADKLQCVDRSMHQTHILWIVHTLAVRLCLRTWIRFSSDESALHLYTSDFDTITITV